MNNIERRSWKKTLSLLVFLSALAAVIAVMLVWRLSNIGGNPQSFEKLIVELGVQAASELGGGLAVVASIQFGVLVVIVGGQVVAPNAIEEVNTRSALFLLASFPGVLLTPAFVFSVAAAFCAPGVAGGLLVSIPLYLVQLGMSVMIGSYEPGSAVVLLQLAKSHEESADAVLRTLHRAAVGPAPNLAAAIILTSLPMFALTAIPVVLQFVYETLGGSGLDSLWGDAGRVAAMLVVIFFAYVVGLVLVLAINYSLKPLVDWSGGALCGVILIVEVVLFAGVVAIGWETINSLSVGVVMSTALLLFFAAVSIVDAKRVRKSSVRVGGNSAPEPVTVYWKGGLLMRLGTEWALRSAEKSKDAARRRVRELELKVAKGNSLGRGGRTQP